MKTFIQTVAAATCALLGGTNAFGQASSPRPPVIDIHVHAPASAIPGWHSVDSALNIRYRLVTVATPELDVWHRAGTDRFLPALGFPCDKGKAVFSGAQCYETMTDLPDLTSLRELVKTGRIKAFAELIPQYVGMSPTDPRLMPYYALAEEFDIPVGIHMGPGPPGAAYDLGGRRSKTPDFRQAWNDPILLEAVLLQHRKLRLFVMHAGWPMLESMTALLYAHPNVYVDVGVLQRTGLVPRAAYYRHLRGLVDAGFGKRIMFGSDSPAGQLRQGIEAVVAADFLTEEQKGDILCGNAQRFFRLPDILCRR